jgi:hypothetical protein
LCSSKPSKKYLQGIASAATLVLSLSLAERAGCPHRNRAEMGLTALELRANQSG